LPNSTKTGVVSQRSRKKSTPKSPVKSDSPDSLAQKDLEKREKARWQRILKTYGIVKEQFDELDHGHCPICLRDWDDRVRPVVDHDHHTGEVRGILCFYCNHRVVGRHRDGALIRRVAEYLEAPRRGWVVPPKKKRKRKKKV